MAAPSAPAASAAAQVFVPERLPNVPGPSRDFEADGAASMMSQRGATNPGLAIRRQDGRRDQGTMGGPAIVDIPQLAPQR